MGLLHRCRLHKTYHQVIPISHAHFSQPTKSNVRAFFKQQLNGKCRLPFFILFLSSMHRLTSFHLRNRQEPVVVTDKGARPWQA